MHLTFLKRAQARGQKRHIVALAVGLAAHANASTTASADEAPVIAVGGSCPTHEEVRSGALSTLPPPYATAETKATLRVSDQGETYSVSIEGQQRTYSDPARNCAERGRTAAIFATLVLRPPVLLPLATNTDSKTNTATSAGVVVPTTALGLSLSVVGQIAGSAMFMGGFDVRGGWRKATPSSSWGLQAGIGWRSPAALNTKQGFEARLTRFPLDVEITTRWRRAGMAPFAEAGAILDLVRIDSRVPLTETTRTRFDPGIRTFLGIDWQMGGKRAFAGLGANFHPRPLRLRVVDGPEFAQTPGASLLIVAGLNFFNQP